MPDLSLIKDAAIDAGKIALKYHKTDVEKWDKGDGQGPVSRADIEIDTMLKTRLLQARPTYGWLSEETEDDAERLSHEYTFIVDPIDGTRAFLAGTDDFSTSIALAKNGTVIAGIVHCPAKELTYWAGLGQGAYLNGEPLSCGANSTLQGARVLASGSQLKPDYWLDSVPALERHFRSSLAYRLCLVAQGQFDAMFTFRRTWEWDVAAGDLICTEAGAAVTNKVKGITRYNQERPYHNGLVAGSPQLHRQLSARIK